MWKMMGNTLWAKPASNDNGVQGSIVMCFVLKILLRLVLAGGN